MTIYQKTDRTPFDVWKAIESAMNLNKRKQTFTVSVNKDTGVIVAGPESEQYDLCFDYGSFKGFAGIRRERWSNVPGYADKICLELAEKMKLPEWATA